jgi:hypothetical protein
VIRLSSHKALGTSCRSCSGAHLGVALHAAEFDSVPLEHDLLPDSVYPLLHVGEHELPLERIVVHGVACPFVTAADASQYFSQH